MTPKYFVKYDVAGSVKHKMTYSGPMKTIESFTEVTEDVFKASDPPPKLVTYRDRRRAAYPSIGDQLDALWKGGVVADEMKRKIADVKLAYPKS